ncbi:enoyl-CoA delta isomerase 1, mitochondrial-like [Chironomus tepperi]|uniref:enoyl-CoA delta isomerase 1, mitochondrial-like n=1 Tax=Chironomus tepperi TaxID=113505 RepID=UPI00391F6609
MSRNILLLSKAINSNVRRLCTVPKPVQNAEKLVLIDVNDKTGYGTLSINRLPSNSLNKELFNALSDALDEMERNKSRGIILTSTSPKIFSSGLDLDVVYHGNSQTYAELWSAALDCFLKLYDASFPSAAAVNGHAIGGGCFYAMTCDYRAMVNDYKIGLNEIQVGIALPKILVMVMGKLLPRRHAELSLTLGTVYSAIDAQKVNLVDDVVADKAEAIAKCEEFLNRFRKIPMDAVNKTKRSIRREEIEYIRNHKQKDIDDFVKAVESVEAQNTIKMYYEALKNKK